MSEGEWIKGSPTEPGLYWLVLYGHGGQANHEWGRVWDGYAPKFHDVDIDALTGDERAEASRPYLYVDLYGSGLRARPLAGVWVIWHTPVVSAPPFPNHEESGSA